MSVHNVINDITINTKQILIGDLIHAFMDQLDDHLHLEYLLNNCTVNQLFNNVLSIVEENHPHELNELFDTILDFIKFSPTDQRVVALMDNLISHFSTRSLQANQVATLLSILIRDIEGIYDKETLQLMFLLLAEKLSFFDYPEAELLKETTKWIYKQATSSHNKMVNELFLEMAKVVSPQTVVQAAAPYHEKVKLTTPILPKGCVFYQELTDKIRVGIEVEKGNHDVIFGEIDESLYKQVAYPKLLFWFDIQKNGHMVPHVVAIKDLIINDQTELYHFPYSNVFRNGNICWNTLKQSPEYDLRQLEILPYIFLGATKNMDLYVAAHDINLRDLLESMQGEIFDDSLLIPMNKKVRDLIY